MSTKRTYTIQDREDYAILIFEQPVDQETEVDDVNEQIMSDLGVSIDAIDWRDDQECWVWETV